MNPETINMLLAASTMFFLVAQPIVIYYAVRLAKAGGKLAKIEVTPELAKQIESFAATAVEYTREQTHKFIKGLASDGPSTPDEKKAVAVQALKTMTAETTGVKLSTEVAVIAVEAAVQRGRSTPPGAPSLAAPPLPAEVPTTYRSLNPPPESQP